MHYKIAGILNVTPDSLSDGGLYYSSEEAVAHARKLISDGAHIIDVGADSTRPGSVCVGADEEIKRLERVLSELRKLNIPFGVDTHHGEVARIALSFGAQYINDISGGYDHSLLEVVSEYNNAEIVLMHSRLISPHVFGEDPVGDIVETIVKSLHSIVKRAESYNIKKENIILDTGMGGFISSNPSHSFELISRYKEVTDDFSQKFMLGISRKGFLGREKSIEEKDLLSKELSLVPLKTGCVKYLRVHEVL